MAPYFVLRRYLRDAAGRDVLPRRARWQRVLPLPPWKLSKVGGVFMWVMFRFKVDATVFTISSLTPLTLKSIVSPFFRARTIISDILILQFTYRVCQGILASSKQTRTGSRSHRDTQQYIVPSSYTMPVQNSIPKASNTMGAEVLTGRSVVGSNTTTTWK